MQVGSLQYTWESAARQRLSCGSYQSACSTGEETRSHSSREATWAFLTGMEQPLAESPSREGKRTVSEPSLWNTPSRPQANARGRCNTGKSKGHLQSQRCTCKVKVKVKGALASTILRECWLASESQSCLGKHVLERWSWLISETALVLLVDTSKATQEQALQVWEWNIQMQQ